MLNVSENGGKCNSACNKAVKLTDISDFILESSQILIVFHDNSANTYISGPAVVPAVKWGTGSPASRLD